MEQPQEQVFRVRLPRGREMLGLITELLGASRFRVTCQDQKERICRIPGRFRKRITLRIGDAIIVEPWEIDGETRGDIVWIYTRTQRAWLERNHYLD